jgi:hypothetical protein
MLVSIGLLIIWFHLISHTSNFVVAFSLSLHHTKKMTGNNDKYLTPITPDQVTLEIKDPVDPTALEQAKGIISRIKNDQGTIDPVKLMNVAQDLGDIPKDDTSFVVQKEECKLAFEGLTDTERNSLINIHARVKAFAEAQRNSVTDMEIDIPGGKAGHTVRACYGK